MSRNVPSGDNLTNIDFQPGNRPSASSLRLMRDNLRDLNRKFPPETRRSLAGGGNNDDSFPWFKVTQVDATHVKVFGGFWQFPLMDNGVDILEIPMTTDSGTFDPVNGTEENGLLVKTLEIAADTTALIYLALDDPFSPTILTANYDTSIPTNMPSDIPIYRKIYTIKNPFSLVDERFRILFDQHRYAFWK